MKSKPVIQLELFEWKRPLSSFTSGPLTKKMLEEAIKNISAEVPFMYPIKHFTISTLDTAK